MQAYEFSESQNGLLKDLAQKMQFVGYFTIAVGALGAIGGLVAIGRGGIGGLIQGALAIVVGVWTLNAAKAFQRIVTTQGNDIENLLGALGELRKLYTLQYWVLIVALVFITLILVVTLFMGATAPR